MCVSGEREEYIEGTTYHRVEVEGGRVQVSFREYAILTFPLEEEGFEGPPELADHGWDLLGGLPLGQLDLEAGWIWEDDDGIAVSDQGMVGTLNRLWESYLRSLRDQSA